MGTEYFDAKQEYLNLNLMLTIILVVMLQVETYLCQRPGGDITHPRLFGRGAGVETNHHRFSISMAAGGSRAEWTWDLVPWSLDSLPGEGWEV